MVCCPRLGSLFIRVKDDYFARLDFFLGHDNDSLCSATCPYFRSYIEPSLSEIGIIGVKGLTRGKSIDIIKSTIVVSAVFGVLYVLLKFIPGGNDLFAGVVAYELLLNLLLIAAIMVFVFGMFLTYFAKKTKRTISDI